MPDKSIQFIFGLHDHQPVGNFGHVFEEAYVRAYGPFLELMENYEVLRVALHHTGPLLNWLEENRPKYFDRMAALVERGQVELLGGAFYEPILPIIPEEDRVGQIVKMSDWIERRFGVRPRGMWLAERVWEPTLPRAMRRAGIEFTVLDDSHFKSVGIGEEGTLGYWLTEDQGDSVAIFPINEQLRYMIPYAKPEKSIEYLRSLASDDVARTAVMADDGEKFGVWPDMYWHCYEQGWLKSFCEKLEENSGTILMKHFGEVLDETAPMGRVYLPTASYVEMMQWAMPPQAISAYEELVQRLKDHGTFDKDKIFVRGGFWRSFFSKYEESNHLHKKMLHVSRKLHAAPDAARANGNFAEALDHLWQAQCNCAYWHGVFGGLYLTNLRTALYKHLIAAESLVDNLTHKGSGWVEFTTKDFDCEGVTDLLAETQAQALLFKPALGGMLLEHDIREARFNLQDTLMRRRESYHEPLLAAMAGGAAGNSLAPAKKIRVKDEDLEKILAQDWYRRGALIDHFLADDATPETFRDNQYYELGSFVNSPYACEWKKTKSGGVVTLTGEGVVWNADGGQATVRIEKSIEFEAARPDCVVTYKLTNTGGVALRSRFGVEFNVNLLAGNAPDRYHEIGDVDLGSNNKMISVGSLPNVSQYAVVDRWLRLRVAWKLSTAAEHWRLPIETAANSVEGVERIYQSTVLMPVWRLDLAAGQTVEVTIKQAVELGIR